MILQSRKECLAWPIATVDDSPASSQATRAHCVGTVEVYRPVIQKTGREGSENAVRVQINIDVTFRGNATLPYVSATVSCTSCIATGLREERAIDLAVYTNVGK